MTSTADAQTAQTSAIATIVIFCLCFSLVLWTVAYRGLYADGSNLLLHVIQYHNFFHVSQTRVTSTFMTQLPAVLAIRFGVRSTAILARLYTIGLAIVPIASYALSVWIARRQTVLFCATIVVIICCFYPLSFLLVGEGNVYLGLFWLAFTILMSESSRDNLGYDGLLVLISAAALEVYETSAFYSVILAVMTGWRANRRKSPLWRFMLLAASALFAFGALCGLMGILFPRDRANESGFTAGLHNLRENVIYLRLLALAFLSTLVAFVPYRAVRIALTAVLFAGLVIFANKQFHPTGQLALGYVIYQRAQVYCTLSAVVALVFVANWLARNGQWTHSFHAGLLIPPLIAVLAIDTVDTLRWSGFIGRMCRELSAGGTQSHTAFFADSATRRYGVNWTFPTMSVLSGSRVILALPGYTGWQPFDPRHPPLVGGLDPHQSICH